MAQFVEADELNTALTTMINQADNYLWFISPYIKLNDRIKFNLTALKERPHTEIVIVFGKNENDVSKSMSLEDLKFFIDFPNIKVMHVANLHAKYYGSEDFAIITSMNLYEFSQVTNLEAGVILHAKNTLKKLANMANPLDVDNTFENSFGFFGRVIKQAKLIYEKKPKFKSTMLGLTSKYERSDIVADNTEKYYKTINRNTNTYSNTRDNNVKPEYSKNEKNIPYHKNNLQQVGYCIRTGVPIDFDPTRPFSYDAYKTWAQFENMDFGEAFCHLTGKQTFGRTSMRNPIINMDESFTRKLRY